MLKDPNLQSILDDATLSAAKEYANHLLSRRPPALPEGTPIPELSDVQLTAGAMVTTGHLGLLAPHNPYDAIRIIGKVLAALQANSADVKLAQKAFADGYNSINGPTVLEYGTAAIQPDGTWEGDSIHRGGVRPAPEKSK